MNDRQCYVPYAGKEWPIGQEADLEVLTSAPGAIVEWKGASNGQVIPGGIGPFGNEGYYVGRAMCPAPENLNTPGKLHPTHQCLYISWGGDEKIYKDYEQLIIRW